MLEHQPRCQLLFIVVLIRHERLFFGLAIVPAGEVQLVPIGADHQVAIQAPGQVLGWVAQVPIGALAQRPERRG